jgi:hypothetical protein
MATLHEWMDANGHDDKSFGALVGRDRSQIYRIRNGTSRPSDDLKVIIAEKTAGAVPVDVWFGDNSQAVAA